MVIKYVPYVGDSKRAMDEYTSEIMMGGTNTIALHNTCEVSGHLIWCCKTCIRNEQNYYIRTVSNVRVQSTDCQLQTRIRAIELYLTVVVEEGGSGVPELTLNPSLHVLELIQRDACGSLTYLCHGIPALAHLYFYTQINYYCVYVYMLNP